MTDTACFPLPLLDGTTLLVTVGIHQGRAVSVEQGPSWDELRRLCAPADPRDVARDYGYRSKLPGASRRLRGAARLWALVIGHCQAVAGAAEAQTERDWQARHPGATPTLFGDRTGD